MAKRRKNRTHLKGAGASAAAAAEASAGSDGTPKTFIVKHGVVGSSVSQLVRDTRKLMEPNTASRLRVSSELSILIRAELELILESRKENETS